jgi:hypothetical protein
MVGDERVIIFYQIEAQDARANPIPKSLTAKTP